MEIPAVCGDGWLKASSLKNEFHIPWLAAGCAISRLSNNKKH